jgi:hypothetical protein
MNTLIVILMIIGILLKLCELFFLGEKQPKIILEKNINLVNAFIKKEASFEINKWVLEERFQKLASTGNPTFINQLTNSEEIKKKVAVITNIIAEKMSRELHAIFNVFYKKELKSLDNKIRIDIALREYIARHVFFMFRRISYDITIMINSDQYKSIKLEKILNIYIRSLEETIYYENNIYLIGNEQNIEE